MSIKVHLRYDVFTDTHDLFIFDEINGRRYLAKPLVMEELEGGLRAAPTARFHREDNVPEQFKQCLNVMGMIDHADAGTLKAKDYHLEDMRRLVFDGGKK